VVAVVVVVVVGFFQSPVFASPLSLSLLATLCDLSQ